MRERWLIGTLDKAGALFIGCLTSISISATAVFVGGAPHGISVHSGGCWWL